MLPTLGGALGGAVGGCVDPAVAAGCVPTAWVCGAPVGAGMGRAGAALEHAASASAEQDHCEHGLPHLTRTRHRVPPTGFVWRILWAGVTGSSRLRPFASGRTKVRRSSPLRPGGRRGGGSVGFPHVSNRPPAVTHARDDRPSAFRRRAHRRRPHAHPGGFERGRPARSHGRLAVPARRVASPGRLRPAIASSSRALSRARRQRACAPTPSPTPATATVGTPNVGPAASPAPDRPAPGPAEHDPRQVQAARGVGHDRVAGRAFVDRGQRLRRHRPPDQGRVRHGVLDRQRLQDVPRHPDPGARPGAQAVAQRHGPGLAARGEGLAPDHDPPAARPHERPLRLLREPEDRPGAAQAPRADLVPGRRAELHEQALVRPGHLLGLLQLELRPARPDRRAGDRPHGRHGAAQAVLRSRWA